MFDTDVDVVYFFAGLTGTHQSFEKSRQYVDVNVAGLLALCDFLRPARGADAGGLSIHAAGLQGERPAVARGRGEGDAHGLYAASKLMGEHVLQAYHHAFGPVLHGLPRLCAVWQPGGHALLPTGPSAPS